ncbi:MAG TPA: glucuronate isomerase [Bryobacteraceae bacterium]|nr:glucuronate isomerase [Bryobacteraceae bacterium]
MSRTKGRDSTDSVVAPQPIAREKLAAVVEEVLAATPVLDIHTHLFPAQFVELGLWGIDDLLTYHYLEAELFRFSSIPPQQYWELSKTARADLIWRTLFQENTPISEAARGVVAVLAALGLDTISETLEPLREYFRRQRLVDYIPRVFALAGVSAVVMTNDPLDPAEAPLWEAAVECDPRFHAVLRLDRILNEWTDNWAQMASNGYAVEADGGGRTIAELRRFLEDWSARMRPVYMAVSLPDTFQFPGGDLRTKILREAILPACQEWSLPLSLMIGVRRQVNPALRLAGDAAGRADLRSIAALCREYPENRFLVSVLSRENQHELCVYARKFRNLMPFGCWWFLNNPSIVEEVTRERLEMLGVSFIPQHSDARILEQVIYKWRNTRRTMLPVLTRSYEMLAEDGRPVTVDEVRRDVARLFHGNFEHWTNL